jgi:hypothetical protein
VLVLILGEGMARPRIVLFTLRGRRVPVADFNGDEILHVAMNLLCESSRI